MGLSEFDPAARERVSWNAGRIYKATGNLRTVQILLGHTLLGHTKIESTVRGLGVDVEDALTLAEGTET